MNAFRRARWLERELDRELDVPLYPYYIPRELGGAFVSLEEVGALVRVVAQRDVPTALAHAFGLLGAVTIWLAGDATQQRTLADLALRGERISVALREPAAGSDLLAMTATAQPSGDGYRLTGDKWLDDDVAKLRIVIVYARTSARGGPRGFSLFLVDKAAIAGGVRVTGKAPIQCVRGVALDELRFGAQLPGTALIGAEGSGFEVLLKALQISRTICGALSLGALDTSVESVLHFALHATVDGELVADLPHSQRLLCEAWAELLIGDSLTGVALRGMHAVSSQASVHSAVVKYLVPTLAEQAMQKLAVIYGARHHLRQPDEDPGLFHKMYRDNHAVSLFDGGTDGNTQSSLFGLTHQLRSLVIHFEPADEQAADLPETDMQGWAHHASPPVELDWTRFSLSAGGEDAVLAGFEAGTDALRAWLRQRAMDETGQALEASLVQLAKSKDDLFTAIRALSVGTVVAGHPEGFELARRYCVVEAAAAVLIDWRLNRAALTSTLADPAVLAVVLQRLTAQLGDASVLPPQCYRDCFAALLARRARDGRCSLYVMPPE